MAKRLREEKAKKTEDERHRTVTAETDAAEAEVDQTRKREERLLAVAIKHKEEEAVNNIDVDEGMNDTPPTANDDPDNNSFDERFKYDSEAEAWIEHGLNGSDKEEEDDKDDVGHKEHDNEYYQDSDGHLPRHSDFSDGPDGMDSEEEESEEEEGKDKVYEHERDGEDEKDEGDKTYAGSPGTTTIVLRKNKPRPSRMEIDEDSDDERISSKMKKCPIKRPRRTTRRKKK